MPRRKRDTGSSSDSADGDPRRDLGYAKPGTPARRPTELGRWAKEANAELEKQARPPTKAEIALRKAMIREDMIERAAIFEYLGGVPRADAERMAKELVYPLRYVEVT